MNVNPDWTVQLSRKLNGNLIIHVVEKRREPAPPTVPSPLLAGALTASLSLWVRVNSGNNVVNSGGVDIFGDAGGKLSATLCGSGSLQLGGCRGNGTTNGHSTCGPDLGPGDELSPRGDLAVRLAKLFPSMVSRFDSDIQVGSIGVVWGHRGPSRSGSGPTRRGTDVTLDEPTLWVGYALSAQDVLNLRDRAAHPR